MNHKNLRKENNCLNCGQLVDDRYCTHCGQENLQLQDSAFHLIIHYIQDIFHYDGKFWHTLKMLLLKPGLVAVEYMEGKRRKNLEPLRFYVFASTVFFLLLFYFLSVDKWQVNAEPKFNYRKRLYNLEQEKKYLGDSPDTAYIDLLRKGITLRVDSIRRSEGDTTSRDFFEELNFKTSVDTSNDGWLATWLENRAEKRNEELNEKHEGDQNSVFGDIMNEAFHKLPQILFVSMPFFAFFLKLLYFRKRRNYVEHFIFSIYFFAYMFVVLGLMLTIQNIHTENKTFINIFSTVSAGLSLYLSIYLILSMKRFYQDRWRYLIPRYLLLGILFFGLFIVLFIISIFVSYMWG